jgi:hypothetical protein
MAYNFNLVLHGLMILVFEGTNKRTPDAVYALLPTTSGGHQHLPYISFPRANLAANSTASYSVVPGPDGKPIGLVSLADSSLVPVTLEYDTAESPKPLGVKALWWPSGTPNTKTQPSTPAEEQWLNWVPSLQKVNPGIKDPKEEAPYAGLDDSLVAVRVKLPFGNLRAGDIARKRDGSIILWDFKPTSGSSSIPQQAIANTVVLSIQGLTKPIWFDVLGKRLGLESQPAGTEFTASLTHLPGVEPTASRRLMHFEMFYDLTPWNTRPADINLPERPTLPDTSYGTICPNGIYTKVPT